jgi:hypothetical protein
MSKFSQRHYEVIAEALASTRPPTSAPQDVTQQWLATRSSVMDRLGNDNPKFRPTLFEQATEIGL